MRTGVAAKELAAKFFVKSPGILDQIQNDANSNARHKIDAIRELRATATGSDGEGPTSQGEKFSIVINLGSDVGDRIERTFDVTPKRQSSSNWIWKASPMATNGDSEERFREVHR